MKNIQDISLEGKRVLIRVDFNVPLDEHFNITDNSRILAALPTIKKVISCGGKAILMSHLGRPKDGFEEKFSLKHIVKQLSKLIDRTVTFSNDCIGESATADISKMENGDVLVLENLRFYKEEKLGGLKFAKQLSELADIYINDAFGTAHRAHASTAIIADYFPNNKYFGFLLSGEIESLEKALTTPKRPFTAIIGGAKITGKIDVITKFELEEGELETVILDMEADWIAIKNEKTLRPTLKPIISEESLESFLNVQDPDVSLIFITLASLTM